jgi:exodeoxyribonuclease V alpha subunit
MSQNTVLTENRIKMQDMLAKIRAAKLLREQEAINAAQIIKEEAIYETERIEHGEESKTDGIHTTDKYGNQITLNDKQASFAKTVGSGQSAVLIGAAGTGKTTCQKVVTQILIQNNLAGVLNSEGHKHLQTGTPGIVVCAYTRRAVANIRRNMPDDMQSNCITIHKLLEYQPVYYEVYDDKTGDYKNKMQFEATRNENKPLPESIRVIIFEESSMLGLELYKEVINACPHQPQLIFLGDIQQLPPVFGPAILGFKLLELPVVELTEVYRQALESPIISLAHRILSGAGIPKEEFPKWQFEKQLTLKSWSKRVSPELATDTAAAVFDKLHTNGLYDPEEDIILIPFNKSFGTDELNKHIANMLAKKRNATVFEVIAGFNKFYCSVGDKVLYDKEDAIITKIEKNPAYAGAAFAHPSPTMDYWGYDPVKHAATEEELTQDNVDFILNQVASTKDEDRVRQCSHILTLEMRDSDSTVRVDKASDVNAMLLGYCLTVHKAQGSEWRKVFFFLHQSHATMIQRELLYTAVTRAREELVIFCEPESFVKGIASQKVKGDTLEEKAEFFKGRLAERNGEL